MARMRGFSTLLRGIRAMDLVVFGICCASFLFGADLAVASFGHDVSSNSPRAGAGLAPLLSQHAGRRLARDVRLRGYDNLLQTDDPTEEEYRDLLRQRLIELSHRAPGVKLLKNANGRHNLTFSPKNGDPFTADLTTRQAFDFLMKGELECIDSETIVDGLKMTNMLASAERAFKGKFTYSMHRSISGLRFRTQITSSKFNRNLFIFPELQKRILTDPEVLWKQLHIKRDQSGRFTLNVQNSSPVMDGTDHNLSLRNFAPPSNMVRNTQSNTNRTLHWFYWFYQVGC
eukprot:GHVT01005099.1.p1 GENE.GHVT01005099.1~~GHVT01005099.1.p1  ORF type:complete len:287 (+),score=32.46 GHVT01005099.1:450-1310(+)